MNNTSLRLAFFLLLVGGAIATAVWLSWPAREGKEINVSGYQRQDGKTVQPYHRR